jgi:hypothetical protein
MRWEVHIKMPESIYRLKEVFRLAMYPVLHKSTGEIKTGFGHSDERSDKIYFILLTKTPS